MSLPVEFESPQARRWLWLGVLGGHAVLLAMLWLQSPSTRPVPLEIELSLSSASQDQPISSAPVQKTAPVVPVTSAALARAAVQPSLQALPKPAVSPTSEATSMSQTASAVATPSSNNSSFQPTTQALVLPNSDAAYLTNPKPGYPPLSRRLGEQGIVTLNVLISTSGSVQELNIAKSSGFARLDEAASRTVQGWRFSAGTRAGVPEVMWVKVPISFILEK
jgi:protein TonB